jgi:hypothetical protein
LDDFFRRWEEDRIRRQQERREAQREASKSRRDWTAILIALLAAAFTGWQGFEAHRARIDAADAAKTAVAQAQNNFNTTRQDAKDSAAQARQDALDSINKQLDASKGLKNEAARSAKAAEDTAKTAALQVEVAERPWIKIKPTLVTPLTFNSPAYAGETARANIQLVLENTGTTVALNVLAWSDILPLDPGGGYRTALKRRSEWCDANRHPNQQGLAGFYLFPNEPFVELQTVGPPMKQVIQAARDNVEGLKGKVGFVLVGCVSYRAPLQTQDQPRHETLFMYYLGRTDGDGFNPYFEPSGSANLQLIGVPDGFSAD